ncbi:MAG: AmmeMemoRadiSam system protein B [bacterium]
MRKPSVAGLFYPEKEKELKKMINSFLEKTNVSLIKEDIFALISPHAGYIYSGEIAAFNYKILQEKKPEIVILIGPSHQALLKGISIYEKGKFKTPLGEVEIDEELAEKIKNYHKIIYNDPIAHIKEHSLEVQLPFLQVVLKKFKIVPILINEPSLEMCNILADAIINNFGNKKVVLIASTDLSHYHSYNKSCELDEKAISIIKELDAAKLLESVKNNECELCGLASVLTTIIASKKMKCNEVSLLKYANSGDTSGDKSKVVGYCSMAIYNSNEEANFLNEEEKKELLNLARKSIEEYFNEKEKKISNSQNKKFEEKKGIFVTIHKKGKLRGCIGYVFPYKDLWTSVSEMAIHSAFNDSRFPSIKKEELNDLEIEISVLSSLKKIENIDEIKIGVHGLYIKKDYYSGLLLPQVATEYNWTKKEFLENVCLKANLSITSWKESEIYIFSAQIFSEK